ncbi:3-hydroxy acyl-CoA dehydratase [Kwoniella heveanensis CBS 569]|nr:3-hydroxy acyl-CoA dehydratase [Kwoniella heveanensis CBS 569]
MAGKPQTQTSHAKGGDRVEQERERLARLGKDVKSGLTPLKIYLLAYNVASALLWANLLYITTSFLLSPRSSHPNPNPLTTGSISTLGSFLSRFIPTSAASSGSPTRSFALNKLIDHLSNSYEYKNLGWYTKWTQSLAVLEVVHALFGWVRSPVGTVAAQVASRVWTVWGVAEAVPEVSHTSPLFATMLLAWSLTEVIRYSFYALSILQIQSPLLNWLRYTTFIPLYPLGASSEAFLSFSTLPSFIPLLGKVIAALPDKLREQLIKTHLGRTLLWNLAKYNAKGTVGGSGSGASGSIGSLNRTWGPLEYLRLGLFVIWWPALYVLYTYMLKQRRKVIGGAGRGKTVSGINKAR